MSSSDYLHGSITKKHLRKANAAFAAGEPDPKKPAKNLQVTEPICIPVTTEPKGTCHPKPTTEPKGTCPPKPTTEPKGSCPPVTTEPKGSCPPRTTEPKGSCPRKPEPKRKK